MQHIVSTLLTAAWRAALHTMCTLPTGSALLTQLQAMWRLACSECMGHAAWACLAGLMP